MNRNASRTAAFSLFTAALLAGCGSTPKKDTIDYKSPAPQQTGSLEVPPDLIAPTTDDRFALPSDNSRGTASLSTYSVERQQAAARGDSENVLPQVSNMHIERVGSDRWLVMPGTPESVWPQLRNFWQSIGLVLVVDSPQLGIMETDWAENRAKLPQDFVRRYIGKALDQISDTNQRDKFRTRVERSSVPGMVEIYVSHRGADQISDDRGMSNLVWQPTAPDPDMEVEMLRRMMLKFGATETVSQQAVAQVKTAPEHAKLATAGNGIMVLTVNEPLDRAWRQVGLSLDRVGLVVEDRDRSKNTYFVRYIVTEDMNGKKDESWFSKLAFWRGKKDLGTDQFRIVAQPDGQNTKVTILNKDGAAVPSQSATQMLTLLYNDLK
ncbi:MAG TPA: outer membrane protein assembly factor BamC [Rhodocyclaceae bacterium]|nr:outer membrane protein assembly factor BamC [Rhodocyclaceae bacterium]